MNRIILFTSYWIKFFPKVNGPQVRGAVSDLDWEFSNKIKYENFIWQIWLHWGMYTTQIPISISLLVNLRLKNLMRVKGTQNSGLFPSHFSSEFTFKRFVSTIADYLEKKKKLVSYWLFFKVFALSWHSLSLSIFFLISSSNHGRNEITDYRLMNLFIRIEITMSEETKFIVNEPVNGKL